MIKKVISHLRDNSGDENISKMIWIAIVFVVGAFLLLTITTAFKNVIGTWYNNTIDGWFNEANGGFAVAE